MPLAQLSQPLGTLLELPLQPFSLVAATTTTSSNPSILQGAQSQLFFSLVYFHCACYSRVLEPSALARTMPSQERGLDASLALDENKLRMAACMRSLFILPIWNRAESDLIVSKLLAFGDGIENRGFTK